jgi:hypothetical protein
MLRHRSFGFSPAPIEQRGLPAFVPTDRTHRRADAIRIDGRRVIAAGVAVLPPLPAAVLMDPVREQGQVINVRRFGLVLLTGCGHPRSSASSPSSSRSSTCPSAP